MIVAAHEGGVRLVIEPIEAEMIATLADQVEAVLGTEGDPALERLVPAGYEDAVSAREFARYTRDGLLSGKREAARVVREATAPRDDAEPRTVDLDAERAWAWLRFLTDLRLILAERLDLDAGGEPQTSDPGRALEGAYEWAGYIQGSMLEVLG